MIYGSDGREIDAGDFTSEELADMSPRSRRRLGLAPHPPSEAAPYRPPLSCYHCQGDPHPITECPRYQARLAAKRADARQFEFKCRGCGETFCDNDIHAVGPIAHETKNDGTHCGSTQVEFAGTWGATPKQCSTTTPEPHEAGEFPMTCYQCHLVADA